MKTLVSKHALKMMALWVCFLSALPIAQGAEPITISMTADQWQTKENAEFLRQLGFYHGLMRLNSGNAVLKDITFSDGTIEFDVNTIGRGAPGIAFRQQDEGNFELLYLRPDPNCPAFRGLYAICAGDSWRPAMGPLSPISNAGAASGERVESHQNGRIRPAHEHFRERCHIAHTAGRQVRGRCDERRPATAGARHFREHGDHSRCSGRSFSGARGRSAGDGSRARPELASCNIFLAAER